MKFYSTLSLILIIFSSLPNFVFAESLVCSIPSKPSASLLRIDYTDTVPKSFFFKSPGSNEYRKLNVTIEPVFPRDSNGDESFSVKPIIDSEFDWSKEPECFKEVGTQWYFILKHQLNSFLVQFTPYFVTSHQACPLPHLKPQTNELKCELIRETLPDE